MTIGYATCPLCEAICGISVDVEGNKIVSIRGDDQDPFSKGYICPKAAALEDIHSDPDRIRTPLRRSGDRWHEISWAEAIDDVVEKIAGVQKQYGRNAAAIYLGNPVAHNYGAILSSFVLMDALGTHNVFTSNSVDGLARLVTSSMVFGSPLMIPIPDIDRTCFLLILGANPAVSNGSHMTAPGCKKRLAAIRERGGKVIVIDPRRSETALIADEHHFIRPGTDAMLLAALVHTIIEEGLAVRERLPAVADVLSELASSLRTFSPERVATAVGMGAHAIRALARAFAAAPSAVCYGRMGICVQEFGTLATWLVDVLNAVTGNLDRTGGAMFPTPAIDIGGLTRKNKPFGGLVGFDRFRSRVRNLPEFNGELPASALAEEIETEGEGQVRALITQAGNPVLSLPNGRRLDRALEKLDFMVSIDLYKNETTRHADLILPTTFGLEHDHYPAVFHALAVRNTAKYSPPLLMPPPGVSHEWDLALEVASRLWAKRNWAARVIAPPLGRLARWAGPRAFLRWALRFGPRGKGWNPFARGLTLGKLEEHPHGIDLGPLEPRLDALFEAGGDRLHLAPPLLLKDLDRLSSRIHELTGNAEDAGLLLIGRRDLRTNNSWMHNSHRLVKGPNRCTLLMHPEDAEHRGIENGKRVCVTSRVGSVEVEVKLTDTMMRGVVSLPHGWGHDREGTDLSVAQKTPGVSVNDLTDDMLIDKVSGCTNFSGVHVTVSSTVVNNIDVKETSLEQS